MWYCTKYALTQGIWEIPDDQAEIHGDYLYVNTNRESTEFCGVASRYVVQHGKGEYFKTLEEAQFQVANMVERKLRSLEKQRAKFEKIADGKVGVIPWKK
jgi:hypothetical protein